MHSELMRSLLEKLRDPDASSSILPLVIVLSFLILGLALLAAQLVSKLWLLRRLRRRGGAREIPPQQAVVIYLNRGGRLRRFFRRVFLFAPDDDASLFSAEVESLRRQLEQAGHALHLEREGHAKALRRVAELHETARSLEASLGDAVGKASAEAQRRARLQEKVEALEAQLQEAVSEVERLYRQNSKVHENKRHSAEIGETQPPAPPPEETVSEKEIEIQRLKTVLSACRDQMLRMTDGKPFQSRITPKK